MDPYRDKIVRRYYMDFYMDPSGNKLVSVDVCLNLKQRLDLICKKLLTDKFLSMHGWVRTDYGYFHPHYHPDGGMTFGWSEYISGKTKDQVIDILLNERD